MKKKIIKSIKLLFIIIFIVVSIFIIWYKFFRKTNVTIVSIFKKVDTINAEKIIYLDSLGLENCTCTGITYDIKDESFWICDYGNENNSAKPRLIELNYELNEIKNIVNIDFTENDINLQGVSYSSIDNTLWIATGKSIYNLSKDGKILRKIDLKNYSKYSSNGIAISEKNKKIYVLCYEKYLLEYDLTGKLIDTKIINYFNQDHITINNDNIYITIGADYKGNNNYLLEYNINNKDSKFYKLADSFAIEGIAIYNNKMYIANDGKYHSAKIPQNYIAIYKFK